uniref:Uncharacterized protein n=1 Tax=Arundo donax TaxID=35708 RepID=A0A0A9D2M2_ARUDO
MCLSYQLVGRVFITSHSTYPYYSGCNCPWPPGIYAPGTPWSLYPPSLPTTAPMGRE